MQLAIISFECQLLDKNPGPFTGCHLQLFISDIKPLGFARLNSRSLAYVSKTFDLVDRNILF